MDRKEFLRSLGLASGCMLFCGSGFGAAIQEGESGARRREFFERWITSLMKNIEELLDEDQIRALMEACGRDCAHNNSSTKMAEGFKGQVEKAVETMAGQMGKENCYLKDNEIFMRLSKCSCPLVGEGPEILPDSYCLCSEGFVKEFFSIIAEKPVGIETLKAVKRGDSCCEFVVKLPA
jgi:predicted hydrocarbon binding protein